jgi:hypothetical protein
LEIIKRKKEGLGQGVKRKNHKKTLELFFKHEGFDLSSYKESISRETEREGKQRLRSSRKREPKHKDL